MKKFLSIAVCITALQMFSLQSSSGQGRAPYNTAFGLMLDVGTGGTYVGPHAKRFFSSNHAGQAMILFGNNVTVIGAEYSYNAPVPGADGLHWNAGIGPQVYFGTGTSGVLFRPQAGIEFKVPKAPLAAGFDWRPMWEITNGTYFEPARFALTFKYTLQQ